MKIYLARHGQDEDNALGLLNGHRDRPLTHIGIEQAKQLAENIKNIGLSFDKVYSSPLQRAYCTAEIITDTLGMNKPEKLDSLIERDFGVMTGKPIKEIESLPDSELLKTETITYFLSPDGAENFPQLLKRADKVLDWIKKTHGPNEKILLVTHGDFGKMLYTAYYHLNWQDVLKMFHFGNSELLLLSEDSKPEETHVFKIQQYNH